jgi:hypothetical protein
MIVFNARDSRTEKATFLEDNRKRAAEGPGKATNCVDRYNRSPGFRIECRGEIR